MKHREPRRSVLIDARVRAGASWSDARILNLSSRGMLMQSATPLSTGSYLEIRRGQHVIVARVVWANAGRAGVRTQDLISADELLTGGAAAAEAELGRAHRERRAMPRTAQDHERSRWRARMLEFGATLAFIGFAGTWAFNLVADLIATPMHAVEAALAK